MDERFVPETGGSYDPSWPVREPASPGGSPTGATGTTGATEATGPAGFGRFPEPGDPAARYRPVDDQPYQPTGGPQYQPLAADQYPPTGPGGEPYPPTGEQPYPPYGPGGEPYPPVGPGGQPAQGWAAYGAGQIGPPRDPLYSYGPQPETVIVDIAGIQVTSSRVHTPVGEFPLRGSQWAVSDQWLRREKIPTWAIVLAIVGFCVLPFISLLFLLARETVFDGVVAVTVTNGPWRYETRVPVTDQAQVQYVYDQINYARSLAAL